MRRLILKAIDQWKQWPLDQQVNIPATIGITGIRCVVQTLFLINSTTSKMSLSNRSYVLDRSSLDQNCYADTYEDWLSCQHRFRPSDDGIRAFAFPTSWCEPRDHKVHNSKVQDYLSWHLEDCISSPSPFVLQIDTQLITTTIQLDKIPYSTTFPPMVAARRMLAANLLVVNHDCSSRGEV